MIMFGGAMDIWGAVTLPDPVVVGLLVIWAFSIYVARFPRSDIARLERLAHATKSWLVIANRVSGTKAAVYGVVGVIFGAAAGLTADFVTTGEMSDGEVFRGVAVLIVFAALALTAVYLVQHFLPDLEPPPDEEAP
jgi:hypothetical protein